MRAEIKGGGKLMRRRNLKVALVNTVLAAIILGLYLHSACRTGHSLRAYRAFRSITETTGSVLR